jgi:hypothetical protein
MGKPWTSSTTNYKYSRIATIELELNIVERFFNFDSYGDHCSLFRQTWIFLIQFWLVLYCTISIPQRDLIDAFSMPPLPMSPVIGHAVHD